jgi:asparagine synthase (glutamine-hydrolysing)
MCGITGAFALNPRAACPLDEATLRRMTEVMAYRGPDDAGHVFAGGAALGARRLSIVDIEGGHQPFANERRTVWGMQNGEIYNHDGLRDGLRAGGHEFRSRCDTEVLPHLFEERGPELIGQLRGKFAVAVWDEERRRGVIARDRLGIKPLYWARSGDTLVFGSELKCVIASGLVTPELDGEALAAYLAFGFVPAPMTPLAQVRKLMPGERLVVENGGIRLERYWDYPTTPAPPQPRSAARAVAEFRDVLDEAIESRLMSDVPLGAMLSGGLDSSLIVALMRRHLDEPVKTFAIGFSGGDGPNELSDARRVADALGTDHHELEIPLGTATGDLDRVVWHNDEPIADLSALGFLALSELASRHVTVALSGQGADELLGGYRRHIAASLAASWQRIPRPLRRGAARAAAAGPAGARRIVRALDAPSPAARFLAATAVARQPLLRELLVGSAAAQVDAGERIVEGYMDEAAELGPLEAALYLDARLGLVDDRLHYFDRASMAWSLEVRVPFLDHHVVEYCAMLPPAAKVRRTQGKHLLREVARDLVPPFVLEKRKLGFFSENVQGWLGSAESDCVDALLAPDARTSEVVDPAAVRRLVSEWRAGQTRHARPLLALVMLERWLDHYLPRAFALADASVAQFTPPAAA